MAEKYDLEGSVNAKFDEFRSRISRKEWLTNDEIIFLQSQYKKGFDEAKKLAVMSTTSLAYSIASEYSTNDDLKDLAQEAVFGIMKAFEKYKPERNAMFTTYAGIWIRNSIRRHLTDKTKMIRVPVYSFERNYKVLKYMEKNPQSTDEEIADACGIPLKRVDDVRKNLLLMPRSLNEKVGEDGEELMSFVPGNMPGPQHKFNYKKYMGHLTPQQQKAFIYRHGLDNGGEMRTLEDVGSMMVREEGANGSHRKTITRERVRQLYNNAIKKLRQVIPENARI